VVADDGLRRGRGRSVLSEDVRYSALLFHESTGALLANSLKHHRCCAADSAALKDRTSPAEQSRPPLLPTHYLKAAYVHNMLRHLVATRFSSGFTAHLAVRFASRRVGLSDFQHLAES